MVTLACTSCGKTWKTDDPKNHPNCPACRGTLAVKSPAPPPAESRAGSEPEIARTGWSPRWTAALIALAFLIVGAVAITAIIVSSNHPSPRGTTAEIAPSATYANSGAATASAGDVSDQPAPKQAAAAEPVREPLPVKPASAPTQPSSSKQRAPDTRPALLAKDPTVGQEVTPKPPILQPTDVTTQFPVLYVTDGGKRGLVEVLEMSLKRSPDSEAPVLLALAEDTPSGTGETIRSSAWLALMVTALNRNDDLAGTAVTITMKGSVDGPSAGAVMCLAMMSALDGRVLPNDFALTGTIMPDGSIGRVGGVPAKMRAAAAKGYKRILVPAFARFEDDPASGQSVDLKALAKSLNLTYLPVESIEQAYSIIHGLSPAHADINETDVLTLPPEIEEWAKTNYQRELAAGDAISKNLPPADKETVAGDPFFEKPRVQTESAIRSGKLLVAWVAAKTWHRRVLVAEEAGRTFVTPARNLDELCARADPQIQRIINAAPNLTALVDLCCQNTDPLGSQFCLADIDYTPRMRSLLAFSDAEFLALAAKIAERLRLNPNADISELDHKAASLKIGSYGYATDTRLATREPLTDDFSLSKLLPKPPPMRQRASQPERLFYSAYSAAYEDFQNVTVKAQAKAAGLPLNECLIAMCQFDPHLAWRRPDNTIADGLHRWVQAEVPPPPPDFTTVPPSRSKAAQVVTALSTQMNAEYLALISGNSLRWNDLDTSWNADASANFTLTYGRTDFLSELIARRNKSPLEHRGMQKDGIPCIEAIYFFEDAEFDRDDKEADKVDVLCGYWGAGLQAKALTMLFEEEKKAGLP